MLYSDIKNNLKTILRDPTTAFAALVAAIMQFMYGLNTSQPGNQIAVHYAPEISENYDYVMSMMMDIFAKPVYQIAFPFLGVIIAVNLFKEKRSHVYDLMLASRYSFHKLYISKIITYYIIGLAMSLILGLSFEIVYIVVYSPFQFELDWLLILGAQIAWIIALYTSCLLIPIALGVFAAALSGIAAAAPIANCAYYYLPYMLPAKMYLQTNLYHFVHVVPFKLSIFMKYWPVQPDDWYEVTYGIDVSADSALGTAIGSAGSFQEAIISYLSMIAIAAILLTASYPLLQKRYEKA